MVAASLVTGWANYRQCREYNSYTVHGPYLQTDNQFFRVLWLTATLIFYQVESDADHSFTEKCFDKRVFNYFLFLLYREIQYIFSICFSRYKLFFIFLYILHLTSFRLMLLYIFKYKDKRKNTF